MHQHRDDFQSFGNRSNHIRRELRTQLVNHHCSLELVFIISHFTFKLLHTCCFPLENLKLCNSILLFACSLIFCATVVPSFTFTLIINSTLKYYHFCSKGSDVLRREKPIFFYIYTSTVFYAPHSFL